MTSSRTIAAVTGTRAEFGLLLPIMRAIEAHPGLKLHTIATGTHLLSNSATQKEVLAEFPTVITVPMYDATTSGRFAETAALGRAVSALAAHFAQTKPDVVLVLGDRIEAFAAAIAASISGIRVAHVHGGDRAEGQVDESIRHAISKLAHIHFPATPLSSHRLVAMGEEPRRIHVVGSPAIDDLSHIPPLSDSEFTSLGSPEIIILLHPTCDDETLEHQRAQELIHILTKVGPTLLLHPNHDTGREGVLRAITESKIPSVSHLPRKSFIGLLKRAHVLVGNSSAGLIECAALGLRVVNIGPRQNGRESPPNVVSIPDWDSSSIQHVTIEHLTQARKHGHLSCEHSYGDGRTGLAVADLLVRCDFTDYPLTKLNTY